MLFYYQAFGIPVVSEIELPALSPIKERDLIHPITVRLGKVPDELENTANEIKPFSRFNENEFRYELPGADKYYVKNGNEIVIEPAAGKITADTLLHFYSNCLAAALFQRNRIPFHVSGVFTKNNKVLLFAAPSRTGKSTLALKLHELGYHLFTDDTALLFIENGKCFAQASYPMMKQWQNTLGRQNVLVEEDKQLLYEHAEINKFAFSFHDTFTIQPAEVAGIVFLASAGTEISIKPVDPLNAIADLGNNVYRRQWIKGMKKNKLQFETITKIIQHFPCWQACRPERADTFNEFAKAIQEQIILSL